MADYRRLGTLYRVFFTREKWSLTSSPGTINWNEEMPPGNVLLCIKMIAPTQEGQIKIILVKCLQEYIFSLAIERHALATRFLAQLKIRLEKFMINTRIRAYKLRLK